MSQVKAIFLIAGNTITGVLRGVVLNVLLVLAALMIIVSLSSDVMDPVQVRRMLMDSGLAVITVLGALIAILTGFTMIPTEIDSRTIYPVLTKPVRRWTFVIGKFFGAASVNGITIALLSVLFFLVYFLKTHEFDPRLIAAVFMIFAQVTVLSALIVFFSTFMSWIGTIMVSMVVWFMGSYSQYIYDMVEKTKGNPVSALAFEAVQKLMPNFQAMDLRYAIVNQEWARLEWMQVLAPLGNGCFYMIIALGLAILIFNYREL